MTEYTATTPEIRNLADLADKFSGLEEWERPCNLEYIYGASDILVWLAMGRPKPDGNMAATNSRLYYLLTAAGF